MTVYLSGRVSGDAKCRETFAKAEKELSDMGYEVLNPTSGAEGLTDAQAMRRAVYMLLKADAMVMLPHWEQSDGALIERHLARRIGLPIWNHGTLPPLEI